MLADCVRRRPCLFDLQHNDYENQRIKENAWKNVFTNKYVVVSYTKLGTTIVLFIKFKFFI